MTLWKKVTLRYGGCRWGSRTDDLDRKRRRPTVRRRRRSNRVERSEPAKKPAARPARTAANTTAPKVDEVATEVPNPSTVIVPSYLVTQPKLADRVQPLLQKGADVQLAAEGFRTPELFAAVAHAAHKLDVPFVVLKHRVLNERLTLSKAIAAVRPDVNADRTCE